MGLIQIWMGIQKSADFFRSGDRTLGACPGYANSCCCLSIANCIHHGKPFTKGDGKCSTECVSCCGGVNSINFKTGNSEGFFSIIKENPPVTYFRITYVGAVFS